MEAPRMESEAQNWFDRGGDAYARYRPDYPDALAGFLAESAPDTRLALDVGCGNGQFTRQLGDHFDVVVGSDPSADQIAHAVPHPRVRYEVGPAERLGAADGSASLITAAQAAHWFDLPRFYAETRRVAVPGAVIALVSYGVVQLEPDLNARFQSFYRDEIGPYWPPERKLVDTGYAGIHFPFRALPTPDLDIVRAWPADAFLGYVSTWSAVRHALEAGKGQILAAFSRDLLALWGDPATTRQIVWPINMRLGVVG
jgi:SAM-dependent methyltransferase